VSALAQYLEREGIPTVSLSLIREHSAAIKSPRTLWVPFELGRPLGVPGDAQFQQRVLRAALALFDAPTGPVLTDYCEDAPAPDAASGGDTSGWACPVSFPSQPSATQTLGDAVCAEVASLKPWYELGVERRGRTTVGLSGKDIDTLVATLDAFAITGVATSTPAGTPDEDAPPAHLQLKYAVDDVLAFYQEAVTAQPTGAGASRDVMRWFWTETQASKLFEAVRERAVLSEDSQLKFIMTRLLVPRAMADEPLVGAH
jgi:hypothetical protein